jgi:hypothetical protein
MDGSNRQAPGFFQAVLPIICLGIGRGWNLASVRKQAAILYGMPPCSISGWKKSSYMISIFARMP